MCRRVTCSKCGKPTWAGCGMHIETALAGVPEDQRCKCPRSAGGDCSISRTERSKPLAGFTCSVIEESRP